MVSPFEEGTYYLPIFLLCVPIVLIVSKCLACQLPTPGIDIHLRQTIPSQQNPISPHWTYPYRIVYPSSAPFQKLYHYGVWVIFLKKNWSWIKKRDKTHTSTQKSWNKGSNKKTRNSRSVSPFPPSPLNTLPSIRLGFDRVPTSCEPLFGSASQVTKVCYILPTQNSTY